MNSSFHPKVILLLGKNKARLFVGSCNLTTSGYYINNEISNMIDYDIDHSENLSLIQDAMNFFLELNEKTDKRDNELIQKIKILPYYRVEANINNDLKLIHNINKSIIEQSKELIKDKVKEIDIAVPYYDPEALALKEIKELYPDSKIKLYIQNERNNRKNKRGNKNKIKAPEHTKRKKKIKLIILLIVVILILSFGIHMAISANSWKSLVQEMSKNENSIVKDTDGNTIAEIGSEKAKNKIYYAKVV